MIKETNTSRIKILPMHKSNPIILLNSVLKHELWSQGLSTRLIVKQLVELCKLLVSHLIVVGLYDLLDGNIDFDNFRWNRVVIEQLLRSFLHLVLFDDSLRKLVDDVCLSDIWSISAEGHDWLWLNVLFFLLRYCFGLL